MPTYEEVLSLAKRLSYEEQTRLREALSGIDYPPVEVEGADEIISGEEIAESEMALQDYLSGCDTGISSEALKQQLFGGRFG
jgi:hypothetical protein